ncbi:non-specific lipid-transfer protein A-like [Nymphaea colorata]|nr:non-specific lipid-transfer protein A-like [Nymphaea colorata]
MRTMMTVVLLFIAATAIDGRRLNGELQCELVYNTMERCLPYVTGISDRPFSVCCDGVHRLRDILRTHDDRVKTCECLKAKVSSLHHLKESALGSLPIDCGLQLHFPISLDTDCSRIP